MNIGPWQIVIIAVIILLLFGKGKISHFMGDFAKGITSFKKGLKEGDTEDNATTIDAKASDVAGEAKDKTS